MNQDAREDHTLRNALLLTGGLAAGGVGGVKLLEKAAMKNVEKAGTVKIVKNLENGGAIVKVKTTSKASSKATNNKVINKTTSKIKTPQEIQQDIDRLKKLLAQEELILIEAEKSGNNAKIAKSKDLISKMKKALAALGVPINA